MSLKVLCKFASILLSILLGYNDLSAILDGRVTPIHLDTTYAFTNFEFATGFVKFNQGLDVPTGGTIFLNVNQFINGVVQLNGGTIIMQNDLYLGPEAVLGGPTGYIKTNNYKIYFMHKLAINGKQYFSDDVHFNGLNSGSLTMSFPMEMHLENNVNNFSLERLYLFLLDPSRRFVFPTGNFNSVVLDNIDLEIFSLGSINFRTNIFQVKNRCIFRGQNSGFRSTASLRLVDDAKLEIDQETRLIVRGLILDNPDAQLYLNNRALLSLTSTENFIAGRGSIKLSGQVSFNNSSLVAIPPQGSLIFESGARLTLDKTKLRIR